MNDPYRDQRVQLPRIQISVTLSENQIKRLDELAEQHCDISRELMIKNALAEIDNPEHPDQSVFLR